MTFQNWLHRRTTHENNQPTIVADDLIRHLQACGWNGVSKRDLLAGMRVEGGESFDDLIQQWVSLGEILVWRSPSGEMMLRWAGCGRTN